MSLPIPWGLMAIVISLSLFYYFNQKTRIKKEERREKLKERHQAYLDTLLDSLKNKDAKEREDS